VLATCRDPSKAENLQKLKKEHTKRLHILPLDVSSQKSIETIPDLLSSKDLEISSIDWLINNAAILSEKYPKDPLSETDSDDMMNLYRTNVVGPMLVSNALYPFLVSDLSSRKHIPCIMNITTLLASVSSYQKSKPNDPLAFYPTPSYRCSKAALNMLTQCMNKEFNGQIQHSYSNEKMGIIVLACSPGWVDTDMGRIGGGKPPVTPQQSIQGMLTVIQNAKLSDSGTFFSFDGTTSPW